MLLFFAFEITERYAEYLLGFLLHKKRTCVLTRRLKTTLTGEYASVSSPAKADGLNGRKPFDLIVLNQMISACFEETRGLTLNRKKL